MNRIARISLLLIILSLGIFIAYRFLAPTLQGNDASESRYVTISEFEQHYGIRVTLIAVTAAGGLVDFRFKVLDAEKAQIITQDSKYMLMLDVVGSKVQLSAPTDTLQPEKFENGDIYLILFGNPRGIVRPGTPVSVVIGDLALEPIAAR